MGQRTMDAMARLKRSPWPWLALFVVVLVIGLVLVWPLPGASQEATPPRIILVPVPIPTPVRRDCVEFADSHKGEIRALGLSAAGNLIQLYVVPNGQWAIGIAKPGKPTCIAGTGTHWFEIPSSPVAVDDPS